MALIRSRRLRRTFVWLAAFIGGPLALIVSCQSKLIYFPRSYGAEQVGEWQRIIRGRTVDFTTSQGKQRAFLQGNLDAPRNLWIVFGGNGTLALEWSDWLSVHAPREDAFLLMDPPGYGDCEGSPNPDRIRESLRSAVPIATRALGWAESPDPKRLRFFGHSLGAASALIAASEFSIQRGVLLAPFTSTMEMSRLVIGVPLGLFVTHRFDNQARLDELVARGVGRVAILHGSDDEVIPPQMGRELASRHPSVASFTEVPAGRHNDIPERRPELLARALSEIGRP